MTDRNARTDVTYCEDCDNVHLDTRKLHPKRWMCAQEPLEPPTDWFVSKNPWDMRSPYRLCHHIRMRDTGICPNFEPRREIDEDQPSLSQQIP